MSTLASVAAVLAGGYLAIAALITVFQRNILYLPDRERPSPAAAAVPDMAEVTLHTADGLALVAWYRPADGNAATIVYFHGNGGHIGYRGRRVRPWLDAGVGLLLVEYRGYGGNPGKPNEQGLYADGRAALAFLKERGIAAGRLVLYGESLGTCVAAHIAAEQAAAGAPVAALVLEAPLSSAADVARVHFPYLPVRWLLLDRFETESKIGEIAAPLLIVHGEADRVVPVGSGRKIFAAARDPKQAAWLPDAGHDDLEEFGLHAIVLDFLTRRRLAPVA